MLSSGLDSPKQIRVYQVTLPVEDTWLHAKTALDKSQTKVTFVLECLLETIFSIFTIISILLFLKKITILPPNYVISTNQGFWAFSSHRRFSFYYLNLLQPPGLFSFQININLDVIYCFFWWIQGLSPRGFKEYLVDSKNLLWIRGLLPETNIQFLFHQRKYYVISSSYYDLKLIILNLILQRQILQSQFGQLNFCQLILLFNLFLLLFIIPTTLFGTIHRYHCTISTNIYLYLQYFQQKVFNFNKISGSQIDPQCQ